jgi:Acetyltransferase (GNAT) domain
MKLWDAESLQHLGAPADGAACITFVRDCMAAHGNAAIRNVDTRMHVLDTGEHLFPVSENSGLEAADNSYVVSPLTAYAAYAQDELRRLARPGLTWPLRCLVGVVGAGLAHAGINRLVQVNNWLLSTNIYPPHWQGQGLADLTRLCTQRWPDHCIGFRSLNHVLNAALMQELQALGYLAVPSRQVYVFDGRAGPQAPFFKHHNTQLDAALLRKTSYRVVTGDALQDTDYARLEQLYQLLYLDKYCPLNPQYTATWLRCGQRDGWLELRALRSPQGRIDGVVGWVRNAHILTAPIVGYDTALPQRLGLYRLLTHLCLQRAAELRMVLNFSSGAAHFKRLRGGQPAIEYSMVYVRHLPRARQWVWRLLAAVLHGVGVPLMKGLQL